MQTIDSQRASAQKWIPSFRFGSFYIEDARDARSERPLKADDVKIYALIDANCRIIIHDIAG